MELSVYLVEKGIDHSLAVKHTRLVKGILSSWASGQGWVKQSLLEIDNAIHFEQVINSLRSLAVFDARNTRERGVCSDALYAYLDYLLEIRSSFLTLDTNAILADPSTSLLEKQKRVDARKGQGEFRDLVYKQFKSCPVTGEAVEANLIAVHLRPWRYCSNQEQLDTDNGLLLCQKLVRPFLYGFFSIADNGEIWISRYLKEAQLIQLLKDKKLTLEKPQREYLRFHRAAVFRR